MNDLKFAVRQLLKNPGFTAVAVLTLALGIGASTAIFSVVYGVLISPYPYARPNEIWTPGLRSVSSEQIMRPYPYTGFERMAKLPGYADVMATKPEGALLTGEYAPENMRVVRVSGSAFRFIGVPALIGRGIQPSDIRPNGEPEPVVVLSFNCWHRLFNGNTNALGKVLRLDEQPYTVVGVMPPRFGWWTGDGVWAPLAADSKIAGVFPIVRLEPGVSAEAARQQLHTLHLALAKERPADFPNDEFSTTLSNYMDMTVAAGEMHHSLWLLSGAVAFLLLIACANVANLQLARATSRAREMAIRLSMGARRARLIRQLLTESVLLSFVSGVCGLLLALWITQLMVSLMPGYFVPNEARIEINGRALLFCLAVSTLTGILFGLVPAFHSSRGDLTGALKDSGRGTGASASSGRTREILVVAEVVLSVVLLVSACLTIRSFAALQSVKLGYRADHVLLVNFPLSPKRYPTLEQRNQFARELLERAARLPGVQSAAFGNFGRPFGGPNPPYVIEGQPAPENRRILLQLVTPGYLDAFGVTMVRGRELTARDLDDGSRVTLINETAARLWPDGIDPIGKRIRIDMLASGGGGAAVATNASPFLTVIGIVADRRNDGPQKTPMPEAIAPATLAAPPTRSLAIRAQGDPMLLVGGLRDQLREMDKNQPLNQPTTIEKELGLQAAQPRFIMALFTLFGAVGLTLATAGVYSVLSFLVSQRTQEIGVRMALGARRNDVLGLFLRLGGRLIVIGLLVGLPASYLATRVLSNQLDLFHVTAADPVSFLGVTAMLTIVALAACYIPARRATRVDPMVALRNE